MMWASQEEEDGARDFWSGPPDADVCNLILQWENAKDEIGRTAYDISEAVSPEAAFTFAVTFIARAKMLEKTSRKRREKGLQGRFSGRRINLWRVRSSKRCGRTRPKDKKASTRKDGAARNCPEMRTESEQQSYQGRISTTASWRRKQTTSVQIWHVIGVFLPLTYRGDRPNGTAW
jgi:hypothetical protein